MSPARSWTVAAAAYMVKSEGRMAGERAPESLTADDGSVAEWV